MNQYQPGNLVTMTGTFNSNTTPPVAIDPTTITLRVTDPTGVETDYTGLQITKNSVGNYSMQLEVLIHGYWNYRWEGLGAVVAASETRFLVTTSAFTNPQ